MLQQINVTGRLEEDNGSAKFFIAEKQQKTILSNGTSKYIEFIEKRASDSKYVTRKWNIVNDQSNANCSIGK